MWNPHCQRRNNAGPLEQLIDSYELIVNNDPDYATRPSSQGSLSIIDLALISPELGPLRLWEIQKNTHHYLIMSLFCLAGKIWITRAPLYLLTAQLDGVFKNFYLTKRH